MEFFAGGGMARLGLMPEFQCVFANDNDPHKCATYRANFGEADLTEADVADLEASDLPSADLAWASFPCQDLSLAGNRSGMTGVRSGAFWDFWRLMAALKMAGRGPRLIVLENVTGLLTSRGGADFAALAAAVTGAGYQIGGCILDAADFVPQSRQRLFLVAWDPAHLDAPAITADPHPLLAAATEALPAETRKMWHTLDVPHPPRRNTDLAALIERAPPQAVWRTERQLQKLLGQMTPLHRARVDAALAENQLRVGALYRRIRSGQQVAEVRYDGLAGCLRTLKGGSSRQLLLISEGGELRLRPMLAREAARLMGLPESYQLPKTTTRAISLCGDGVCVPVVSWLRTHVLAPLLQQTRLTELSVPGIASE